MAISGMLNTILVETLKQFTGDEGMFMVSFMGLILALLSNIILDDEKRVKFTDFYSER